VLDPGLVRRQVAATFRLTRDLPGFVRRTVEPGEALALVTERQQHREQRFLQLLRGSMYADRRGPYRRMLDHAGCTFEDVLALVKREGLEGALARLAANGVHVSQAEMKGRADIVRGSLRVATRPNDFDNPRNPAHFVVPTSGSSGRQLFVNRSLWELAEIGDVIAIALRTFRWDAPAYVKWSTLPHSMMENLRLGMPIVGWFNAMEKLPLAARALQWWVWLWSNLCGARVARPRTFRLTEPTEMARWLDSELASHPRILMDATASSVARVSTAAIEAGISLDRLLWLPWGEPLSAARQRLIEQSGARSMPVYSTVETGPIAVACGSRAAPDEMHVRTESFAVIQHSTGPASPSALLATSLSAWAPKLLLNAETGDRARDVDGACDCELHRAGLTKRVVDVRSIEKLTVQGVTIIGDDLASLIEFELPRRFGGRPGSFQLAEVETADARVGLVVRADPALGPIDESVVVQAVLSAIAERSHVDRHMARLLQLADALRVERASPWTTSSGKLPPFVPLREGLEPG
jgi:hypothetical protein